MLLSINTPPHTHPLFNHILYGDFAACPDLNPCSFHIYSDYTVDGAGSDLNPFPGHSWAGLNLPLPVPVRVQIKSFSNLTGRRCCGQVLLVGKDQHRDAL